MLIAGNRPIYYAPKKIALQSDDTMASPIGSTSRRFEKILGLHPARSRC